MKLYEAITKLVDEFGKDIITNIRVINIFGDYNAFEESKTFKIILKNLINEGYMDQITYVRDWEKSELPLISNFVAATSFNPANAAYVIRCVGYGLGLTKTIPVYQPTTSTQPAPAPTASPQSSRSAQPTKSSSAPTPSYQGIALDKTSSQLERMSEAAQRKYKEAAEAYLESIIEFKSDFEKDLGVQLNTYVEFDEFGSIRPKFEINGKIKVKYNYSIMFHVIPYDQNNRAICKEDIYVGVKRKAFEIVETSFDPSEYHKVSNIKRIVVYWDEN